MTGLSNTMERAYEAAKACGGKLYRTRGGYWRPVKSASSLWFGVSTVRALVDRGVFVFSEWRDGPRGRYPVEATLTGKEPGGGECMKALTICQPYPHLILIGEKPVENRGWHTSYRGPMLIHAGKSREHLEPGDEFRAVEMGHPLEFGAIVGRCILADCVAVSELWRQYPELVGHRHVFGPYCFVLKDPVRFERPIPYRGALGFFEVPLEILQREKAA